MDDFRLGPISPYDSYRDRPPSGSGDRKKAKQPQDQPAGEDEISLAGPGETDPQSENAGGIEDYYLPSGGNQTSE